MNKKISNYTHVITTFQVRCQWLIKTRSVLHNFSGVH